MCFSNPLADITRHSHALPAMFAQDKAKEKDGSCGFRGNRHNRICDSVCTPTQLATQTAAEGCTSTQYAMQIAFV